MDDPENRTPDWPDFFMCGNAFPFDVRKHERRLPKELHDELYGEGAYDERYGAPDEKEG